jgi:hypothetical protein
MPEKSVIARPAYFYDSVTDNWYAVSGTVNTALNYTWAGSNTFSQSVLFKNNITAQKGINNFLNPAARNAALPAPDNGNLAFVRQDASGNVINQVQYFFNGAWRFVNDGSQTVTRNTDFSVTLGDEGKTLIVDSPSNRIVTIPTNTTQPFFIGQRIDIVRAGLGEVQIQGAVGVVLNSVDTRRTLNKRYSKASIIKTGENTWLLIGDIKGVSDESQTVTRNNDFTLALGDEGKTILVDSSSNRVVTIPTNAAQPFVIGQRVDLVRAGTGEVQIQAASGVALNSVDTKRRLDKRYSAASVIKTAENTWLLVGDLKE